MVPQSETEQVKNNHLLARWASGFKLVTKHEKLAGVENEISLYCFKILARLGLKVLSYTNPKNRLPIVKVGLLSIRRRVSSRLQNGR